MALVFGSSLHVLAPASQLSAVRHFALSTSGVGLDPLAACLAGPGPPRAGSHALRCFAVLTCLTPPGFPAEWYDNRARKTNPNAPDFKKKVGGRDGEPPGLLWGLAGSHDALTGGRVGNAQWSFCCRPQDPAPTCLLCTTCSPCAVADEPQLPAMGAL